MRTSSEPSEATRPHEGVLGDWEALAAWRDGDRRAAKLLASRYFAVLMRFFLNKTRDTEDATDLVGETFLGCAAGVDRMKARGSFRSYLFAIAMNKLRGYYRKQVKRQRELDDFADVCVAESLRHSPSSILAHAEEARLLVVALRHLTLAQQIVVELTYFEELRGPEIAELLGLPSSTVHTHLQRGRKRLCEILRELARRPGLAESTLSGLETWALEVRSKIPR